jgi:class 3 adenylate cyclase
MARAAALNALLIHYDQHLNEGIPSADLPAYLQATALFTDAGRHDPDGGGVKTRPAPMGPDASRRVPLTPEMALDIAAACGAAGYRCVATRRGNVAELAICSPDFDRPDVVATAFQTAGGRLAIWLAATGVTVEAADLPGAHLAPYSLRWSLAFGAAAARLGLPVRAGVHTGEIEQRGEDVGGIAVHAAARVMARAGPGEVFVSRVVTDLVAGAGLTFARRGTHELKGLPGRWDLFAADAA